MDTEQLEEEVDKISSLASLLYYATEVGEKTTRFLLEIMAAQINILKEKLRN